ncbi:MAG: glycosyltransferase family 4 protein [Candidatus Methanomethylicia archaeon]
MTLRVLVITPVYYPEVGGGALATYLITDVLARTGQLRLTVLTGVRNPERVNGVNYIYDPLIKLINKRYFLPSLLAKRYQKILKRHDIIYVAYAFPFVPLGKAYGKKVIVHLHDYRPISLNGVVLAGTKGSSSFRLIKDSFNIRLMQKKGVKDLARNVLNIPYTLQMRRWVSMADTILAVSKRHAEILSKYMPECRNKIRVLYNPLPNLPKFEKKLEEAPTFLYCGGDSYVKGFHILIEVLKALGENKQTHFKLILTNKYSQESLGILNKLKRRYNLDIEVHGMVEYSDLVKLHSRAWALLFPSIWEEPLPYTVMEALLAGTLPLAFKVGGVSEIVEKTCAEDFLIPPNMHKRLLEAIETIASYDKRHFEKYFTHNLVNNSSISVKFSEQKLLKDFLDILLTFQAT